MGFAERARRFRADRAAAREAGSVAEPHDEEALASADERNERNEETRPDRTRPTNVVAFPRPLGRANATALAARYERPVIAATLERLRYRASLPDAAPMFAQLAADWTEILAVKERGADRDGAANRQPVADGKGQSDDRSH